MSSFHERYVAWRELHREPAMQYRDICICYLLPERIAEIDHLLKDASVIKLYCHWWTELKAVAPLEAQRICEIDHQLIRDSCPCCGLVITKPPVKAAEPNPEPAMQLAFEV